MPKRHLIVLAGLVCLASALFLLWGLRAPYGFIIGLRWEKLAALLLVGAATGASTVMFQTVVTNRLLTPGIVGFDALYVFLQTALIASLGGAGYASLPSVPKFLVEAGCLMVAALLLFGILFRKGAHDLLRMVLTGVILGVMLRGLSGFVQRIVDPNEFSIIQQATVASFNAVAPERLGIAAVMLAFSLFAAMRLSGQLDVASLGRVKAQSLGLNHDRLVFSALAVVAALVAVSTALVGPITFLGLLAAGLTHALIPSHAHRYTIPAAALIGMVILVLGQAVFERVLGLQSALAIIVEFAGGLFFLFLVLRKPQR